MLAAIGLVYLVMVILFRSLLVPVVILYTLPLAVFDAFVTLAMAGHALDLSALIGLLMLTGIADTNAIVLLDLAVVTNAIVLRDLMQHGPEASVDVRTVLIQGDRTGVRPILMTAAATILALSPLALSSASSSGGGLIARLPLEPSPRRTPARRAPSRLLSDSYSPPEPSPHPG